MCRIDDGGKISHRKLEESGAFYVSVAFSRSAYLRNVATAPQPPGQRRKPPEQEVLSPLGPDR